jgi:hypothetical protein
MKKYKTSTYGALIENVEIERETFSSVWLMGQRYGKITECHAYFDTFSELKNTYSKTQKEGLNSLSCRYGML